mgnify:CR=1 FL=1
MGNWRVTFDDGSFIVIENADLHGVADWLAMHKNEWFHRVMFATRISEE